MLKATCQIREIPDHLGRGLTVSFVYVMYLLLDAPPARRGRLPAARQAHSLSSANHARHTWQGARLVPLLVRSMPRRHSGRRAGATPRTGSGWQGRTAPRGEVPPAAA